MAVFVDGMATALPTIWQQGQQGLSNTYLASDNAASMVFKLAPTSNCPSRLTKGRRTNRGSWSINSSIFSSLSSWSAKPICFKLGLRLANICAAPTSLASSRISCSVKGSLKKSRSSNVMSFCKSNSLTFRQEDQRGHQ